MKIRLTYHAEVEVEVEGLAIDVADDPEAYLEAVTTASETIKAEEIISALQLVGDELVEDPE